MQLTQILHVLADAAAGVVRVTDEIKDDLHNAISALEGDAGTTAPAGPVTPGAPVTETPAPVAATPAPAGPPAETTPSPTQAVPSASA
ncbi:MAG TPA: hypothetical protein VGG75_05610 [Trebonia sp.]|jgi:hypothetical protein